MTIWRPSSLGIDFDLARLADFGGNAVQKFDAKLLVRHLAATETQGDLDLVAFGQEFHDRAHLDLVVMGIGPGTELDLLDLDDLLLLTGLGLALLLFVFELAQIHDLADRGHGVRGNLDKVQPCVSC